MCVSERQLSSSVKAQHQWSKVRIVVHAGRVSVSRACAYWARKTALRIAVLLPVVVVAGAGNVATLSNPGISLDISGKFEKATSATGAGFWVSASTVEGLLFFFTQFA